MKSRTFISIASALSVGLAPLAAIAWVGNTGTPPNDNVAGPVWLNPSSAQSGSFSVTGGSGITTGGFMVGTTGDAGNGNIRLTNDLYFLSSNKSIRVDGAGTTDLNFGNYDGLSDDQLSVNILRGNDLSQVIRFVAADGQPGQICLNGSCISSWPSGSATDIWVDTTGDSMTGALNISKTGSGAALSAVNTQETASSIGVQGAGGEWGGHFYISNNSGWDTAVVADAGTNGEVGAWGKGTYAGIEGNGGTYGVLGRAANTGAWDVSLYADAATAGVEFGVYSTGADNTGVYGDGASIGIQGAGGTYGGHFTGTTYGVYGQTSGSGEGVHGQAGGVNGTGVFGYATNSNAKGVVGSTTGADSIGVWGYVARSSSGNYGTGVYGQVTSNAVYGTGVSGVAEGAQGMGISGIGGKYGGYFDSSDGTSEDFGVGIGEGPKYGVYTLGTGATSIGGFFASSDNGSTGVWGRAMTGSSNGVRGESQNGSGGYFTAPGGYGIYSSGYIGARIIGASATALEVSGGDITSTGDVITDSDVYADGIVQGITRVVAGNGTSAGPGFSFANDTNTGMFNGGSNVINFAAGGTNILQLIPGITPQLRAVISGSPASDPTYSFIGQTGSGMSFQAGSPSKLVFAVGAVERMSINSSGNLTISGSTATKTIGTSWTPASDIRLKDVRGEFTYGLNEIMQLDPIWFNYKKGNPRGLDSTVVQSGFVAQEVKKVIPEAAIQSEDGYYMLDVDPIHWASVNAIKELKTENDALKSELNDLKSRLEKLEAILGE